MDLGLADRITIITGGSSEIGLATARLLLEEGGAVAVCGRDRDRLEAAVSELPAGQSVLDVSADVTDANAMRQFVNETIARFGRLDGVAAVASEGLHGRALELDQAAWGAEVAGKLAGVLNVLRPALPYLCRSDAPRVVTVTAPSGRDPEPELAAVSAARAAVANLTRSLALALASEGIAVNAVAVGMTDTERQCARYRAAGTGASYEDWLRAEVERRNIPQGRAGSAQEVARMIALALSPALSYTTGAVLAVTGGVQAP
jgi:NAD(P)-dependent dehydrogenase (short-subunit alcohol dehydrogenase family)